MRVKALYRRYENRILASALLFVLLLWIGIRFDYYYELNDDTVMKDTLSGVYTGVPEGHNIQMLYPLSFLISLCYRIFPKAPVYGIFLCLCQYGCIWLIVNRSLRFGHSTRIKAGMALAEGIMFAALYLWHFVFLHYSLVSALLAVTAVFLFMTSEKESGKRFIRENIPSVFLAVLSYMLRTEMLLMMAPFFCVGGIYRWSMEERFFAGENVKKYLTVIAAILIGMAAAWAANAAAFGSGEWKEFVGFFNSRTELYDFQGLPAYVNHKEMYESLGMTQTEQQMLLEWYNFGLDDTLDAEKLDIIAKYQEQQRTAGESMRSILVNTVKKYLYQWTDKNDRPWNRLVIVFYAAVFWVICLKAAAGKEAGGWMKGSGTLLLLFGVRSAVWMFILMRGRYPERITHSLYLMETGMLFAMLHTESAFANYGNRTEGKNGGAAVGKRVCRSLCLFAALVSFAGCMIGRKNAEEVGEEHRLRSEASAESMKEYCTDHADNFYFVDVYTILTCDRYTPYLETVFEEVDNGLRNYDIMGGWLVKSPTYRKKLEAFGMGSMQDALLYKENVYLMADLSKEMTVFEDYFRDQGVNVRLELTDSVCGKIGVYKIKIEESPAVG